MFNWEELGKIDSNLLRTMRHITFGAYSPSYDGAYFGTNKKMYGDEEVYLHELDISYKIYDVKRRWSEEWPSETYNYQDKFPLKSIKSMKVLNEKDDAIPHATGDEDVESEEIVQTITLTKDELKDLFVSVDGIGVKKFYKMLEEIGEVEEVVGILEQNASILLNVKGITQKLVPKIEEAWLEYKNNI